MLEKLANKINTRHEIEMNEKSGRTKKKNRRRKNMDVELSARVYRCKTAKIAHIELPKRVAKTKRSACHLEAYTFIAR